MHTFYGYVGLFFAVFLSIFGFQFVFLILLASVLFVFGFIVIIYLQHRNTESPSLIVKGSTKNPLDPSQRPRTLGLNFAQKPKKPMVVASKIKIQTETPKHKNKNFIDSGIELFKKHAKNIKDGHKDSVNSVNLDTVRPEDLAHHDKKWNPFETIKVYSEKRKSVDKTAQQLKDAENVSFGVECTLQSSPVSPLPTVESPKKRKIVSGNKQVDNLLHTIIDYVLRDFVESWFKHVSTDKQFSETVREQIETFLTNICKRVKNAQILSLMTTKLIDEVAQHAKICRIATEATKNQDTKKERPPDRLSPQRTDSFHRRNKSETDAGWHLGNAATQKNVANSRFYGVQTDEKSLMNPELRFLNAFFDESDLFREECMDERKLESYLTHVMETVMYFSMPPEEFDCLPLRSLLCTLLANVVLKPMIHLLSDPDFINLQIARYAKEQPPAGEFLLKMIRQCNDLSELRAVRQFITKEMDSKHQDPAAVAELASLKYTQKLIDLRISNLQNNRNENVKVEREKISSNLPILSIDEILTKELALSYYLDYLSILNLQKYVIFYLTAQEWKLTTSKTIADLQMNKTKESKEELMKSLRDKAWRLYKEYLTSASANYLTIDPGLIEVLNYKLNDPTTIMVENTWFDSISKFVYEKLKNDEIFLSNFYQSSAYKKLLLELDVLGQQSEHDSDIDLNLVSLGSVNNETESEGSSDVLLDDDDEEDEEEVLSVRVDHIKEEYGFTISRQPAGEIANIPQPKHSSLMPLSPAHVQLSSAAEGVAFKHNRSHSDCTGLIPGAETFRRSPLELKPTPPPPPPVPAPLRERERASLPGGGDTAQLDYKQKLSCKIINTAIHSDGNYAVYAIQVEVVEENKHKSWHIYRRYSKFLELKKYLIKRFPFLKKVPFPAKKAFANTQRAVLEHRMSLLNEFLAEICEQAERNDEMNMIMRDFLEPDTDDRKLSGGAVIRTIESLVHPFKSGMRTIKNMPDTLVGGISRILLGKGPMKEHTFLNYSSDVEQNSEYPALTSALHLLDEVFDLQARSQWLRRGLINRLLGAPWVSYTANKRIIHAAKNLIEMDKLEMILLAILHNVWPDGKRQTRQVLREDNTKLRTRMAAKLVLFALLSDDLKHLVGSETTRIGLLNFFTMLQNKKLNVRLILVILNDILNVIYGTDCMVKHVA